MGDQGRWGEISTSGLRLRTLTCGPPHSEALGRERHVPLILIPGHTSRLEALVEFAALLGRDRVVVAVEGPGSGASESPLEPPTLALYQQTLLAAIDQFAFDRVVWVGGSLGGHLGLRLAAAVPERTAAAAVWGPAGAWTARPLLGRLLARLWRLGPPAFWLSAWGQSRFWYSRDFPGRAQALRDTFSYYRDRAGRPFRQMYWGLAGDQIAVSLFDCVEAIRCPVWIGRGERDNGAGMERGVARLLELVPNSVGREFAGARHSVETEMPEDLASAIVDFLDRHEL